jgi:hypothetical protein
VRELVSAGECQCVNQWDGCGGARMEFMCDSGCVGE